MVVITGENLSSPLSFKATYEMAKSLGSTGNLAQQADPSLSEEAKEYLAEILLEKLKDRKKVEFLIEKINSVVRSQPIRIRVQKTSSPAIVRKSIKRTEKAVLALYKQLNAIDGETLRLLRMETDASVDRMRSEILQFLEGLSQGSEIAGERNPRGGRPRDDANQLLVAEAAHILRTHTTIKPTATAGGIFEQIVEVLLEAIDGRRRRKRLGDSELYVHDLTLKALRIRVFIDDDGLFDALSGGKTA
jgi:hypothetical protein